MSRRWPHIAALLVTACSAAQTAVANTADSLPLQATVNRYCVTCHNDALLTAGLSLQHASVADIAAGAATWEKVLRKLKVQSMPPAGGQTIPPMPNLPGISKPRSTPMPASGRSQAGPLYAA